MSFFSKQNAICMLCIKTNIIKLQCFAKSVFIQAKTSLTVMYTQYSLLESELGASE